MRSFRSAHRVHYRFRPLRVERLEPRVVPGFLAPMAFDAGGVPSSVAVADFNGDGLPDLAVADFGHDNGSGAGISVLLGAGNGSFEPPRSFPTSDLHGSRSVAVGDVNGDGIPDLVVANYNDATVSVLLGNGDGSFQAAQNFSAGSGATAVAVGDFTGNGHLDLAVADTYGGTVSVLLGNGDGSFQAARTYSVGNGPDAVAVGDFNGDGIPDLVVANFGTYPLFTDGGVNVLLGNGDGSFQSARSISAGDEPTAVAVGDFTGDGHLDLAVAESSPRMIAATVSVFLGNGDGSFQAQRSFSVGSRPSSIAAADFNGDGQLDLAVTADGYGSFGAAYVYVLLGTGDGSFQAARSYRVGSSSTAVVGADVNGDGIPDLVVANSNDDTVTVLLGTGDGSFPTTPSYDTGTDPHSVAEGDFTGDGYLDLVVANYRSDVSVLLSNGDGTFQAARDFSTGGASASVAVGDFNGDGIPDLAVATGAEFGGHTVSVLLGNGDGTFQPARTFSAGASPESVAVGDFNGDGSLDLAVTDLGDGVDPGPAVSVLLGNGDGSLQAPRTYSVDTRPYSVAAGDFNGDGRLDLAVASYGNVEVDPGSVSVLLGNGDGSFQSARSMRAGDEPISVAVGDFTGDGHLDLAVANHGDSGGNGGGVSVLLGNGDGSFQVAQNYSAGLKPAFVSVGDFDGDGRLDLVVGNRDNVRILRGAPGGSFRTTNISYVAGSAPEAGTVADFDGDGWPDLAVVNGGSNDVSILVNDHHWSAPLGPPTRSPLLPAQPGRDSGAEGRRVDLPAALVAPEEGRPLAPATPLERPARPEESASRPGLPAVPGPRAAAEGAIPRLALPARRSREHPEDLFFAGPAAAWLSDDLAGTQWWFGRSAP